MLSFKYMLEKELEAAIGLAKKAGDIITGFYASGVEVEEKIFEDNFSEPVTIADRTASRLIVGGLGELFPLDGILSEEEFDDKTRLNKNRCWIIDPLDGTSGFVEKTGDFAVQIGLADAGAAVLGVVFMPLQNILYYAVKGAGAFVVENNQPPLKLRVSDKTDFAQMTLASSRHHRSPRMSKVFEKFGLQSEVQRGSVGLKVGLIAQRQADLYIHLSPRTKHWDTCAPEIILDRSGRRDDRFVRRTVRLQPFRRSQSQRRFGDERRGARHGDGKFEISAWRIRQIAG